MNIILLGAAGFIGTNLTIALAKNKNNKITVVDQHKEYFANLKSFNFSNVVFLETELSFDTDYEKVVSGQEVVYHLISTTVPTTSNQHIAEELKANVILSANLFDACIKQNIKKVIFISSGGTVYGKEAECPLDESTPTNPITSYGVQKITIEKLLYLYYCMYGLDYRVVRLSNPYGPYQRPNGVLGAVTTFTYKALAGEEINVYGDGSVMRDFIYIDDAVRGILQIAEGNSKYYTYNLGCGYGTSIKQLLITLQKVLNVDLKINYHEARKVDVPVNYLNINRYESSFGALKPISLEEGIKRTRDFMKKYYRL